MKKRFRLALVSLFLLSALVVVFTRWQVLDMGPAIAELGASRLKDGKQSPPLKIEGFGKNTIGGKGGVLYRVTNLNDSGPGSLRDFLNRHGSRIIRFGISGTISLKSHLDITEPFITIDGSDAPAGGVCIKGGELGVSTHEVIIRHIRLRPGPDVSRPGSTDAFFIGESAYNIVLDHCSLSWATDENLSIYGRGVTIQWCMISEALHCSTHPKGCHSMGALIGPTADKVTLHHNLFAHNNQRNPETEANGVIEWVNNVIYNSNLQTAFTIKLSTPNIEIRFDAIGNLYKAGPNSKGRSEMERSKHNFSGTMTLYCRGNIGHSRPNDSLPEEDIVNPNARPYLVAGPHVLPSQTTKTSAPDAFTAVVAGAGATLPLRDAVDKRVAADAVNGTGRVIDDPAAVGGWPDLKQP